MNVVQIDAQIMDSAEYRKRAERCLRLAVAIPATRDDFLMAAETWETLAVQALRFQKQLERQQD